MTFPKTELREIKFFDRLYLKIIITDRNVSFISVIYRNIRNEFYSVKNFHFIFILNFPDELKKNKENIRAIPNDRKWLPYE